MKKCVEDYVVKDYVFVNQFVSDSDIKEFEKEFNLPYVDCFSPYGGFSETAFFRLLFPYLKLLSFGDEKKEIENRKSALTPQQNDCLRKVNISSLLWREFFPDEFICKQGQEFYISFVPPKNNEPYKRFAKLMTGHIFYPFGMAKSYGSWAITFIPNGLSIAIIKRGKAIQFIKQLAKNLPPKIENALNNKVLNDAAVEEIRNIFANNEELKHKLNIELHMM